MGMAAIVEPSPLFETGHIGHESVAFPLRHRVAEPGWIGILGKLTTIGENLAVLVEFFEEYDGFARRLDDLEWEATHQHCVRHAVRHAMQLWFVGPQGLLAVLVQRRRRGKHGYVDSLAGNIIDVAVVFGMPDAREIGLTVGSARSSGQRQA